MPTPNVLAPLAGLTRDQIRAVVDSLTPADVMALAESVPRAAVEADPTLGGPADYAAQLDPTYRTPRHVELLSDAVRRTVENGQAKQGPSRLIVSMPPRVGKSWTSSLWTPAWFLERHPDQQVLLASHEAAYARSWGRKVRDWFEQRAATGSGQVHVARGVSAAAEWETTQGGGMVSRGIGGSITGRGADLLLIDDPIKDFATAHSPAARKKHWDWWLSTAQTRLSSVASVIVVMTRWHDEDLAGRLMSPDWEGDPAEWEVLRIPAIGEGSVQDVQDGRVAPDALDRDAGVPLTVASDDETDEEATARWDRIRSGVGPYIWAGLYQQRPSEPEGTILKRSWWQFYRREGDTLLMPDGDTVKLSQLKVVQSWDLAVKGTATSDYVVGQVWGQLGGRRFLLDQWRGRAGFAETKRQMRIVRERWPQTTATYIEDKANGPAVIDELRAELSGLLPHNPVGDKTQRAYAVQGDLESGALWLPEPGSAGFDVHGLIEEAGQFPNGSHDDQVDALTQAILRMRGRGTTQIGVPSGSKTGGGSGRSPLAGKRIAR